MCDFFLLFLSFIAKITYVDISGLQLSWLEQAAHNRPVPGSSPGGPTTMNVSVLISVIWIRFFDREKEWLQDSPAWKVIAERIHL